MIKIFKNKSLRLLYENGLDKNGKAKFSSNSISNISKNATDESLYSLKDLLEKVQTKPIEEVSVVETSILEA